MKDTAEAMAKWLRRYSTHESRKVATYSVRLDSKIQKMDFVSLLEITSWIMMQQRTQRILVQSGFFGFFDYHDLSGLGLICLVKKCKIHFWILESNHTP